MAIAGGAITVRFAVLLGAPVPPFDEVTALVVFGLTPAVLLITEKMTVQFPADGTVMPVKLRFVAPVAKLFGVVPAHVPVTLPPAALIF